MLVREEARMLTGEPAVWVGRSKCKHPDAEEFLVGLRKNGTMTLEQLRVRGRGTGNAIERITRGLSLILRGEDFG